MKTYLENLGQQMQEGVNLGRSFRPSASWRKVSRICFFGMGGSAVSGDILRILNSGAVSFHIFRFPQFPKWIGPETLAIFSSYSGNTAETLRAFRQALKSKAGMLVVTSGGELERLARRKNIRRIKIPKGFPPRCAIGYLTFSLILLFQQMGWTRVQEKDIRETLARVRHVSRGQARQLARRAAGRFIHFYGKSGFAEPVLARWRAQFAENAKTLTSSHLMPEMFHNEVEGWAQAGAGFKKHCAVFFTSNKEGVWLERKKKRLKKIVSDTGAGCIEIKSLGRSLLARLFSLIALGDWTSYELALLNGVDPLCISKIDELKKIK